MSEIYFLLSDKIYYPIFIKINYSILNKNENSYKWEQSYKTYNDIYLDFIDEKKRIRHDLSQNKYIKYVHDEFIFIKWYRNDEDYGYAILTSNKKYLANDFFIQLWGKRDNYLDKTYKLKYSENKDDVVEVLEKITNY